MSEDKLKHLVKIQISEYQTTIKVQEQALNKLQGKLHEVSQLSLDIVSTLIKRNINDENER